MPDPGDKDFTYIPTAGTGPAEEDKNGLPAEFRPAYDSALRDLLANKQRQYGIPEEKGGKPDATKKGYK